MGLLITRYFTPSELKLVSQDAVISKEEVYEFDGIVDHRGEAGHREYKVRWKNYTAADDSWITADMFTDPHAIINYWRRLKGSVPKKDSAQLQKLALDESTEPSFQPNKKGKILQTIERFPDEEPIPHTTSTKKPKNKQVSKRTSHRTKTV
ncbi:hypothetical protein K501DRAFT_232233, partial [Backusella circina FSU 941]